MNKLRKIIAVILFLLTINNQTCFALTEYTLDEALFYGQAKSFFKGDLKKSTMAVKEKQKAIKGASSGASLSMSLDFMKIFEDGPPYQKLFANITKGPTATYKYKLETMKQPFTIRKTEYTITTAYFNVYKAKLQVERDLNSYNEADKKLSQGNVLFAKGEIDQSALDEQKKKVDDAKKKYESSQVDYNNKITKLNDLVYLKNKLKYRDYTELKPYVIKYNLPGQSVDSLFSSYNYISFKNLSGSYTFNMNLKRARVGSSELTKLVNAALNNNWEVCALQEQTKIDEYYIYACLDLYKKEFGSNSNLTSLENLIKAGLYTVDDLDFTLKYDKFISYLIGRYGEDWSPYFNISLLFFKIKIPKLFKYDQYDGVRYLEDSRYELQQRVMQFLQLVMDLDTQKKTVAEQTSTLFFEINNLDRDYENLQNQFYELKAQYDINQEKYKSGKIKADILISQKDELDELDDKIHTTLIDMNEKILELNYMTNGLYEQYTVSYDEPTPKTDSSPFLTPNLDDLMEEVEKQNKTDYTINYKIESVAVNDTYVGTADLSISVDGSGFDCDKYQIVTIDGIEISEKLNINDKFRHFETVFKNLSDLKVKFFKGDTEMYTGTFDGYGVLGKVIINN